MIEEGASPRLVRVMRIIGYLLVTLTLIPLQALAVAFRLPVQTALPQFYHRVICRILGIRTDVSGHMALDRPVLFVCNHASYLDIEVLGSLLPASFIAKQEVAGWPLFGLLAKLQRSVFVDRQIRSSANQRDSLTQRLRAKENLILFPEGTSNDGTHLKPFKSALFAAAEIQVEGQPIAVQPVTIAYTHLNGTPICRHLRHHFAWYGDMALSPHLWRILGSDPFTVTVDFHQPVTIERFGSRKQLAQHCQQVISEALATANSGRRPSAREARSRYPAASGVTMLRGGQTAPAGS